MPFLTSPCHYISKPWLKTNILLHAYAQLCSLLCLCDFHHTISPIWYYNTFVHNCVHTFYSVVLFQLWTKSLMMFVEALLQFTALLCIDAQLKLLLWQIWLWPQIYAMTIFFFSDGCNKAILAQYVHNEILDTTPKDELKLICIL